MEMIHDEYYNTEESKTKKIIFAIARYEDSPLFYDKVLCVTSAYYSIDECEVFALCIYHQQT